MTEREALKSWGWVERWVHPDVSLVCTRKEALSFELRHPDGRRAPEKQKAKPVQKNKQ